MKVTVRAVGGLGGAAWRWPRTFDLPDGAPLACLLLRLDEPLRAELAQPNVIIVVNGRRVDLRTQDHLLLADGDTVALVAASAGG